MVAENVNYVGSGVVKGRTLYIIKLSSFFSLFGDFCNSDFVEVTVTWQCTQKSLLFMRALQSFFV